MRLQKENENPELAHVELDVSHLPPAAPEDSALGAQELAAAAPGPGGAPALSEEEKRKLETTGMAAVLVELGARIAERRWPVIAFTEEEKRGTVELAVPVLLKYDVRAAWLDKYKEEIALGTFLFKVYQDKAAKVEQAARAAKAAASSSASSDASSSSGKVQTEALDGVADPLAAVRRA